jgi:hypothetical protein
MILEMHLPTEMPDLCKRYRISHHISVRDATSLCNRCRIS